VLHRLSSQVCMVRLCNTRASLIKVETRVVHITACQPQAVMFRVAQCSPSRKEGVRQPAICVLLRLHVRVWDQAMAVHNSGGVVIVQVPTSALSAWPNLGCHTARSARIACHI
jgi:hypothetical protein